MTVTPKGSTAGHFAVEVDGMIIDPSLRDNLEALGQKFDDIPVGQESFTRELWDELTKRFPSQVDEVITSRSDMVDWPQ